jgi:hypothetical protein
VEQFFDDLSGISFSSDLAVDYWHRLVRYRQKLFTFLRFDGVPWNNNNAEHAVKAFAYYRVLTDGKMTEAGLRDYLILLSIYQTCKYRRISFLRFLLSGKTNLDGYNDPRRIEYKKPLLEVYPKSFALSQKRMSANGGSRRQFPNG